MKLSQTIKLIHLNYQKMRIWRISKKRCSQMNFNNNLIKKILMLQMFQNPKWWVKS